MAELLEQVKSEQVPLADDLGHDVTRWSGTRHAMYDSARGVTTARELDAKLPGFKDSSAGDIARERFETREGPDSEFVPGVAPEFFKMPAAKVPRACVRRKAALTPQAGKGRKDGGLVASITGEAWRVTKLRNEGPPVRPQRAADDKQEGSSTGGRAGSRSHS